MKKISQEILDSKIIFAIFATILAVVGVASDIEIKIPLVSLLTIAIIMLFWISHNKKWAPFFGLIMFIVAIFFSVMNHCYDNITFFIPRAIWSNTLMLWAWIVIPKNSADQTIISRKIDAWLEGIFIFASLALIILVPMGKAPHTHFFFVLGQILLVTLGIDWVNLLIEIKEANNER